MLLGVYVGQGSRETHADFTKANPANLTTDFGMFGVHGVMNGAAIIFSAYLGYDAVATLAEEVCLGQFPEMAAACSGLNLRHHLPSLVTWTIIFAA